VRASDSAKVLVAVASVPANRPLEAGELALERHDISATPDALSDMQLAAGKASKRALRTGDVVRSGWLLSPTLVRRGEPVRIVARSGGIEVTVAGEALDAGARGDTVRVRNTATGNIIRARVVSMATVEPAELMESMPDHSRD